MERDRVIAQVEERLGFEVNFPSERISDVPVPPPYSVVPVVDSGARPRDGGVESDLRIATRYIRLYVARVERFVRAAMELDVLLGHTRSPLSLRGLPTAPSQKDTRSSRPRDEPAQPKTPITTAPESLRD
jgi:hypothetical protein